MFNILNNRKREQIFLGLLFLIILSIKLYFSFQTPFLENKGYYEARQIENILQTGFPTGWDELSYSGRSTITNPIYYYILAIFSYFFGIITTLKILSNIFVALISIIVYIIVKKITKNQIASMFSAIFSGFIPALSSMTLLTGSVHSLTFLLMFLTLYFFINIEEKRYLNYFLIMTIILPFVNPISLLLLCGLIFYFILMKLDGFDIPKIELESVIFAIFFTIFALFIQYKYALIMNGAAIVWQNIPIELLSQYFTGVSLFSYLSSISFIPLIFGIYTIYKYTFEINKSSIHVFIGLTIATSLLLWLKLIQPNTGLALIGIALVILAGESLRLFLENFEKTKFADFKFLIYIFLIIIFILTSFNDTIISNNNSLNNSANPELMLALKWIETSTPTDSVILSDLNNGHLITFVAKRKNVFDDNYILIQQPNKILQEVNQLFYIDSTLKAVKILNKFNVDYILFNQEKLPKFIKDQNCFKLVYGESKSLVYQSVCKVEEIV